jgi:CBS domain-containing protein
MKIAAIYHPAPVTVHAYETLIDAAQLMRERHVGSLIVVRPELGDDTLKTVGIITDRDIVVAVIAEGMDPRTLTVGDAMNRQPVVAQCDEELSDVLARMRHRGVRRIAVLGAHGELKGVLSLDDIVTHLAAELESLVGAVRGQQVMEGARRP